MAALRRAQCHLGRAIPADTHLGAGGRAVDAHLLPHGAGRVGPAAVGRLPRAAARDCAPVATVARLHRGGDRLSWLMLFKAEEQLSSSLAGLLIAAVPLVGSAGLEIERGRGPFRPARRSAGFSSGSPAWRCSSASTSAGPRPGRSWRCWFLSRLCVGPRIFNRYLSDLPNLAVVAGSLAIAAIVYAPFAFSNLPAHMSTEVTWSVIGLAVGPDTGRIHRVLRADQRDRARPHDRCHLREPGRCPRPRCRAAQRAASPSASGSGSRWSSSALCSPPAGDAVAPRSPAAVEIAGPDPTM